MTDKRQSRSFSSFGFSTILLSFVMIGVVIFSALSLMTAFSDYKLSRKVADNTLGYYQAEAKVYEKIAALETFLIEQYFASDTQTEYYSILENNLAEYGMFLSSENLLTIEEPISEKKYFHAVLKILYPSNPTDTFYKIIEWKSVPINQVPKEEPMDLFH